MVSAHRLPQAVERSTYAFMHLNPEEMFELHKDLLKQGLGISIFNTFDSVKYALYSHKIVTIGLSLGYEFQNISPSEQIRRKCNVQIIPLIRRRVRERATHRIGLMWESRLDG